MPISRADRGDHRSQPMRRQQSMPIDSREELDLRFEALDAEFGEGPVPRPETWGGWRLTAESVEFWQGQPNRFHDRIRYTMGGRGLGDAEACAVRVHVMGSSGTYPVPGRPASGYLIEQDGTRVWCDAGPDTFTALPVDPDLIDAIVISPISTRIIVRI